MIDWSEADTKKWGGNHILTQFLTLQTSNFTMAQNLINRLHSIYANLIQVISELGQGKLSVQAENHLDYLILVKKLTHLKRLGMVVTAHGTITEQSHICVSQKYFWNTTIDAEWEDMRRTNSTHNIFIHFAHYFQLNSDETCFLSNEGELKIICGKDKPCHEKDHSDSRFSIKVLQVGSTAGMNGPVIIMAKGKKFHQRTRGNNLVTKYGLPERSCVIPKKAAYMDGETWEKVMKLVAPGIRKMVVSNVDFGCSIFFSTYITAHLCPSKLYADD